MIKSMTGYGHSSIKKVGYHLNIEIRTVNSRYLDYKIRGYDLSINIEKKIRELFNKYIKRGNVQIKINLDSNKTNNLVFNKERFDSLIQVVKKVYVDYGQRISLSDLINTSDILMNNDNLEIDESLIFENVKKALLEVDKMRSIEGEKIKKDILNRIINLQRLIKKVKEISDGFSEKKENQLRIKIKLLLQDKELDESRLIQEVSHIAEKVDVTEEITRSKIHIDQLLLYFETNEPVGKKINFLLQEINREINTIGSKSPETLVTFNIVEIKSELEKIREQVQNIL
ncbi:MAG: YicC family protein [Candidatus Marinimicrobia bacterium]|nr:YicC family protein [Candidatus Neomarinimicrobiota bacterium]